MAQLSYIRSSVKQCRLTDEGTHDFELVLLSYGKHSEQFIDPATFTRVSRTNFYCIFCIICHNFSFCILQGSVATCLRCDGKYYVSFVGNVVVFPMVKEF